MLGVDGQLYAQAQEKPMSAGLEASVKAAGDNPSRPSLLFKTLLPKEVFAFELAGECDPALLFDAERQLIQSGVPKRLREFTAGRLCARRAAAQFGIEGCPIGMRADRRPQWPRRLTGSITHTEGYCVVAVAEQQRFRAIGIDAEKLGRFSSEIWNYVLLPVEMNWLATLPAPQQAKVATLMFSAKEAFYKCQYELTEQWLEFKDVTIECPDWGPGVGYFSVRPAGRVKVFEHDGCCVVGRFAFTNDLVLTAIAFAAR